MTSKQLLSLFLIAFISINLYSNEQVCAAKKIQTMKASFPAAKISGYSVVVFDVDMNGNIKKPKVIVSKCLLKNKKTNSREFQDCGIFKYESINAAKFIKYSKPADSNGMPCELKNQKHEYTFLYDRENDLKFFEERSD
ncbi:MAG: hypothetical protein NT02SARS_0617 [SAR86 cluster bacterium SAR86B]|uniref:TonB C-terminal domain-containing protein n=1 Tax=SAR86 cluster bacterium SAR86B TaxID=1123867 RepID=J5KQF6_9GAMM|nr:MAG: hypothetical protein NT02SARS_0617 [SAR86 cluster bacterium SAR86B]